MATPQVQTAAPSKPPAPQPAPPKGQASTIKAPAKTEVETVKMLDGRLVDFPGKRRLQKESFISPAGDVSVRLDFRNGETRTHKLKPAMLTQYAAHGAEQKLGDEISGVDDLEDAVEAIDELMMRLDAGEWTIQKASGGAASGSSVLLRAIVAVTGKSQEAVRGFLKNLTQGQKKALRESNEFAPAVKKIEAEKAAKAPKVDISDTLNALKSI